MASLVAVLAGLLGVLGVLQYRWIGTLGEAEATRMHRMLHLSTTGFAGAIYEPLGRLQERFLLDPGGGEAALAERLALRYQQWRASSTHPGLLSALYHVAPQPDGSLRLARFHPEAGTLVPLAWPEALVPWRVYFAHVGEAPVAPATPPGLPVPLLPRSAADRPGFLLLLLDETYAAETLFPALARTYLLGGDNSDYDLLITAHDDPARVLFQSGAGSLDGSPDATALLGLGGRVEVSTRSGNNEETLVTILRSDSVEVSDLEVRATETERVLVGPSLGSRAAQGASVQPWRLEVRHRAGSIEAAVARWRRRNLGVSFGILLLLGGAAVLLMVSARRARRLAAQQMAFVAGVSHELRTPLAVIRSAAENLADGVVEDLAQARRYGALVDAEGRRLSALVEQVLVLAGAQTQTPPAREPLDLAPFLEGAVARCQRTFEQEVPIELRLDDDLPRVRADARALEAALCNLLSNAYKYGDGWIGMEARLQADAGPPLVALTVRDRGAGIPADELPHLFEPFFRGRAAREAQMRGSGLGLSLVQNMAEAHGGRVDVESTPGRGSAFTLYLPADV